MQINQIVLGMYATNTFIVRGPLPGVCLLVDPADDAPQLIQTMERLGVEPAAVLLTHGHHDHLLAVPDLQKRWPALPVYCHAQDIPNSPTRIDRGEPVPTPAALGNLRVVQGGDTLELIGLTVHVMHTPGHTPGSVTYMLDDVLFTGDTLFCESVGRTDFVGGSIEQMHDSLAQLAALPGEWQVLPGHGRLSTLDHERTFNPYLGQTAHQSL